MDVGRTVDAVWKLESARIIAGLTRLVHDVGRAEEFAQDALVAALEQWPRTGVPDNPARLADDDRQAPGDRRHPPPARFDGARPRDRGAADASDEPTSRPDDVLRLMFLTCHPVLPSVERVALTLRLVAGLTAAEIARAFLTHERADQPAHRRRQASGWPTRARRWTNRVMRRAAVVGARGGVPDLQRGLLGDRRRRPDPGRPVPRGAAAGPDAGRAGSRRARGARSGRADGDPGVARGGPDRRLRRADPAGRAEPRPWDQLLIRRGFTAMLRAREIGRPPGPYVLQAAIAVCHAQARRPRTPIGPRSPRSTTRWSRCCRPRSSG